MLPLIAALLEALIIRESHRCSKRQYFDAALHVWENCCGLVPDVGGLCCLGILVAAATCCVLWAGTGCCLPLTGDLTGTSRLHPVSVPVPWCREQGGHLILKDKLLGSVGTSLVPTLQGDLTESYQIKRGAVLELGGLALVCEVPDVSE